MPTFFAVLGHFWPPVTASNYLLATFGHIWLHLAFFGHFCPLRATFGSFKQLLPTFWPILPICVHLQKPTKIGQKWAKVPKKMTKKWQKCRSGENTPTLYWHTSTAECLPTRADQGRTEHQSGKWLYVLETKGGHPAASSLFPSAQFCSSPPEQNGRSFQAALWFPQPRPRWNTQTPTITSCLSYQEQGFFLVLDPLHQRGRWGQGLVGISFSAPKG